MKALQFPRKPVRYAAGMVAGSLRPGRGARFGPLALRDVEPPELPGPEWVRVRPRLAGICGSDLATIDGTSSRWFEPIVSFPFTPGHEVVGETEDGRRVVVIPVLHCVVRGIDPVCEMCASGRVNLCERVAFGHLEPGLQTGFCESTGGGWSAELVAHPAQLVAVPADLTDEQAVLVEPTACAVHAAQQVLAGTDGRIAVIGAGALGLLTIAALRALDDGAVPGRGPIIATAKYTEQRRWAKELGADVVCAPGELERAVRSAVGAHVLDHGQLTGGVDAVVDCVGSEPSIAQAVRVCAPGGTVHLVGMPGVTSVDLTPVWQREVALRGAYAYEVPSPAAPAGASGDDFATAIDLVRRLDLGRLVTTTYPLSRYEDAIAHAAEAGIRGAVKVAFDLRGRQGAAPASGASHSAPDGAPHPRPVPSPRAPEKKE
ncbi:MAG TPA: zinc-binding dehydrogenase [Acidimicrobiales bacterium]|nr:zinc-binding dehydrogenase [Acidimicrobiales bacterium]